MADSEHLERLAEGVAAWNRWKEATKLEVRPDLSGADLSKRDLEGIYLGRSNLSGANLEQANLGNAWMSEVDFSGANLNNAHLVNAYLRVADLSHANLNRVDARDAVFLRANLSHADLSKANFGEANLTGANLNGARLDRTQLNRANLSRASLQKAQLTDVYLDEANLNQSDFTNAHLVNVRLEKASMIETNLEEATLTNCRIYGINAWNLKLDGITQSNLIITHEDEATITVDNVEVAQFIYLLLNNRKIRDVINTVTSKAVLILGRFTPERKRVLDALREALRERNYLPIIFDFDKPDTQNLTETIDTLAHMARFVIADITEAKSIPQELMRIVPSRPSLPVQPLILSSEYEYAMFGHFREFPWVLKPYRYESLDVLLDSLEKKVISPAEAEVKRREKRRREIESEMDKAKAEAKAKAKA